MSAESGHPSWCEYPQAPHEGTHTHTARVGVTYLPGDATVELSLVQATGARGPVLTMHITAPTGRLSIDVTGTQTWALAGVLIDATVAHAHAVPQEPARALASFEPLPPESASRPGSRARPAWLLDRHPIGRMPGRRATWWSFRCGQARGRPDVTGDA